MTHFVVPADPLDGRGVDEHFALQRSALMAAGFPVSLAPDSVFQSAAAMAGIAAGAEVVYRGWMVDALQHEQFVKSVHRSGGRPMVTRDLYLLAHHLPIPTAARLDS